MSVYDKRHGKKAFKNTFTFPSPESALSEACKYGTLLGALHRFNRATSSRMAFQRAATRQAIAMVKRGYSTRKVLKQLRCFTQYSPSKGEYKHAYDSITRLVLKWVETQQPDEL